jgi:hypothetical protein
LDMPRKDLKFFLIMEELFVFIIDFQVYVFTARESRFTDKFTSVEL